MAMTMLAKDVKAGRELDAEIARSVMGLRLTPYKRLSNEGPAGWKDAEGNLKYSSVELPRYSTDRAVALDVVDKLQADGLYVAINTTCDAGLYDVEVMDGVHFMSLGCAVFKPLALGICLAAREAVALRAAPER